MSSNTTPTYTANSAGNLRASASLGAGASDTVQLDIRSKFEAQIHVKNTPGGTVAATRGVKIEVFRNYGATPTQGESPCLTRTMPSAAASTAEGDDFYLPTGNYAVKFTNLDASNAVTLVATSDTIDDLETA